MPRPNKPGDTASNQPSPKRVQAKHPNGSGNGAATESVKSEDIARRAYEIYQSRGEQHGNDLDHWLEAERELKPGPTSVTGSIGSPKPKKSKKTPAAGV